MANEDQTHCASGHELTPENTFVRKHDGWRLCRICRRAYKADYNRRLAARVRGLLGGKCACCGEAEPEFLCVDHVDGGGNAHRAEVSGGRSGRHFHQWMLRQPVDYVLRTFRLLCWNCNFGETRPGGCPHRRAFSGRSR